MAQENIERLWGVVSSLSKEAIAAAKKKCKEKEFDVNKSIVGLDESLTNLAHIRDLVKDSIEKRKLMQFPFSFQIALEDKLTNIAKQLKDLSEGTDSIDPLVREIDQAYYLIWRTQLETVTPEFLGYQEKLNKIKSLELELDRLKSEFSDGLGLKLELEELHKSIVATEESGRKTLQTIIETNGKISENMATIVAAQQDATAKSTAITNQSTSIDTILKNAKANDIAISGVTKSITEFHSTIEANRKKIDDICATANRTTTDIAKNAATTLEKVSLDISKLSDALAKQANKTTAALEERVEKILSETEAGNQKILQELTIRENDIKDQMAKVTGKTLFGAFSTRMESIVKSKNRWIAGVFIILSLIALLTLIIALTFDAVDKAFYLKLSIYFPLLAGILFCITNYNHERQLEEEYAFKSSISLSLVPYKDLVEKSTDNKEKYAEFLIKAVNDVFTSPTDKVFSVRKEDALHQLDKHIDKNISRLKNLSEVHKNTIPAGKVIKPQAEEHAS